MCVSVCVLLRVRGEREGQATLTAVLRSIAPLKDKQYIQVYCLLSSSLLRSAFRTPHNAQCMLGTGLLLGDGILSRTSKA